MQASRAEAAPGPPLPYAALCALLSSGEARRLREAAGISRAVLAAALGVSEVTVGRQESGTWRPRSLDLAGRYARILRGLASHDAVRRELAAARSLHAAIMEGLEAAERGETAGLGSFAQYGEEEEDGTASDTAGIVATAGYSRQVRIP